MQGNSAYSVSTAHSPSTHKVAYFIVCVFILLGNAHSTPTPAPSHIPSQQPTSSPSTTYPTSRPSACPSKFPTTSHPTTPGETNPPVNQPTSYPTYELEYESSIEYLDYLDHKTTLLDNENAVSFGSFYYKGYVADGSCNEWQNYIQSSLLTPLDDRYISAMSVNFAFTDFSTSITTTTTATCTDTDIIEGIRSSLRSGASFAADCGGYLWRAFTCNEQQLICVNCKLSCSSSLTCPGDAFTFHPCGDGVAGSGVNADDHAITDASFGDHSANSICGDRVAAAAYISSVLTRRVLYPSIKIVRVVTTASASAPIVSGTAADDAARWVRAQVTIDVSDGSEFINNGGSVHCLAVKAGSSVDSTSDIIDYGSHAFISDSSSSSSGSSSSANVTLTIGGMHAGVAYDIHCCSDDGAGHISPINETTIMSNGVPAATSDSRALFIAGGVSYLPMSFNTTLSRTADYKLKRFANDSIFSVGFNAYPEEGALNITITVKSISCAVDVSSLSAGAGQSAGEAYAYPSHFIIDRHNVSLARRELDNEYFSSDYSFFVRSFREGCYVVEASSQGLSGGQKPFLSALSLIRVVSATNMPGPKPISAMFRSDFGGGTIELLFDCDTDRAQLSLGAVLVNSSAFNCDRLLQFTGPTATNFATHICQWQSDRSLLLRVGEGDSYDAISSSLLNVGDTITTRPNLLRAKCLVLDSCSSYPLNTAIGVTLSNRVHAVSGSTQTISSAVSLLSISTQVTTGGYKELVSVASAIYDSSDGAYPLVTTKPVVASLIAPTSVSSCANLYIDATASQGHGGRAWKSIQWKVTAVAVTGDVVLLEDYFGDVVDSTSLEDYLNEDYSSGINDAPIVIPSSLVKDSVVYKITIIVANFADVSDQSSVIVHVRAASDNSELIDSDYNLQLHISSSTRPSSAKAPFYRWQPLDLFVDVVSGSTGCGTDAVAGNPSLQPSRMPTLAPSTSFTEPTYSYVWRVFAEDGSLLPDIQSQSNDARRFYLPPNSLNVSTIYTIHATVSSTGINSGGNNAEQPQYGNSFTTVRVSRSGVYAATAGSGGVRTVSSNKVVDFDASKSRYMDETTIQQQQQQENSRLFFKWTCVDIYLDYGRDCSTRIEPVSGSNGQVAVLSPVDFDHEGLYRVTVQVFTSLNKNGIFAVSSSIVRILTKTVDGSTSSIVFPIVMLGTTSTMDAFSRFDPVYADFKRHAARDSTLLSAKVCVWGKDVLESATNSVLNAKWELLSIAERVQSTIAFSSAAVDYSLPWSSDETNSNNNNNNNSIGSVDDNEFTSWLQSVTTQSLTSTFRVDDFVISADAADIDSPLAVALGVKRCILQQLPIPPGTLSAGQSYTFQFTLRTAASSAKSDDNAQYAASTITLEPNTPPTGGAFTVYPAVGVVLINEFSLSTSLWTDDLSDYPLFYTFSYFVRDETNSIALQKRDISTHIKSYLPMGIKSLSYKITCHVTAADAFGSSTVYLASASERQQIVTVTPQSTSLGNVLPVFTLSSIQSALSISLAQREGERIVQLVGAAASVVNAVDCEYTIPSKSILQLEPTASLTCAELNRYPCSNTANTCGPCKETHTGPPGDGNTLCTTATLSIGAECQSNSSCVSGRCASSSAKDSTGAAVCVNTAKQCPNSCGGTHNGVKGVCKFINGYGATVDTCFETDTSCRAVCQCPAGLYGKDCSISSTNIAKYTSARTSMCDALYMSSVSMDLLDGVTEESLTFLLKLLADIFQDPTQLEESAVSSCTAVLFAVIRQAPRVACSSIDPSEAVLKAVSAVLRLGMTSDGRSLLSAGILNELSSTVTRWAIGCHSYAALDDRSSIDFVSDDFRLTTMVVNPSVWPDGIVLSVPLLDFHAMLEEDPTRSSVTIGAYNDSDSDSDSDSSSSALGSAWGLIMVQYPFVNVPVPATFSTIGAPSVPNSTTMDFRNIWYADFAGLSALLATDGGSGDNTAGRRLVSVESSEESVTTYTVALETPTVETYNTFDVVDVYVTCDQDVGQPFTKTAYCPQFGGDNSSFIPVVVDCQKREKGTVRVQCPAFKTVPVCTSAMVSEESSTIEFGDDPSCTLVSNTDFEIVCQCAFAATTSSVAASTDDGALESDSLASFIARVGGTYLHQLHSSRIDIQRTPLNITYEAWPPLTYVEHTDVPMFTLFGVCIIAILGLIICGLRDRKTSSEFKALRAELTTPQRQSVSHDFAGKWIGAPPSAAGSAMVGLKNVPLSTTRTQASYTSAALDAARHTLNDEATIASGSVISRNKNQGYNEFAEDFANINFNDGLNSVADSRLGGGGGTLLTGGGDNSTVAPNDGKVHNALNLPRRTVHSFVDSIFPDEFRAGSLYSKFKNVLSRDHVWLRMFTAINDDRREYYTVTFIVFVGRVLVILLLNTALALALYADDGFCDRFTLRSTCSSQESWGAGRWTFTSCEWNPTNQQCVYRSPTLDVISVLSMVFLISIGTSIVGQWLEWHAYRAVQSSLALVQFVRQSAVYIYRHYYKSEGKTKSKTFLTYAKGTSTQHQQKIAQNRPKGALTSDLSLSGLNGGDSLVSGSGGGHLNISSVKKNVGGVGSVRRGRRGSGSVSVTSVSGNGWKRPVAARRGSVLGLSMGGAPPVTKPSAAGSRSVSAGGSLELASLSGKPAPVVLGATRTHRTNSFVMNHSTTFVNKLRAASAAAELANTRHLDDATSVVGAGGSVNYGGGGTVTAGTAVDDQTVVHGELAVNSAFYTDEFITAQSSTRATIMLACRLDKMRTSTDFVTPNEESVMLLDMFDMDRSKLYALQGLLPRPIDVDTSFRRRHYGMAHRREWDEIPNLVVGARTRTTKLLALLEHEREEAVQEELLFKHFILDYFEGYRRQIAEKALMKRPVRRGEAWERNIKIFKSKLSVLQSITIVLLLPVIFAAMAYGTWWLSKRIGSESIPLWWRVAVVALLQDGLLTNPLRLWLAMSATVTVGRQSRELCERIIRSCRIILMRTSGQLKESNSLVQHFNSACRAARSWPALPVARLLMSLTDFDIPNHHRHHTHHRAVRALHSCYNCACLAVVAYLPYDMYTFVLDLSCVFIVDGIALAVFKLAMFNVQASWICLLVFLFVVACFIAYEQYQSFLRRKADEVAMNRTMFDLADTVDRHNIDDHTVTGTVNGNQRRNSISSQKRQRRKSQLVKDTKTDGAAMFHKAVEKAKANAAKEKDIESGLIVHARQRIGGAYANEDESESNSDEDSFISGIDSDDEDTSSYLHDLSKSELFTKKMRPYRLRPTNKDSHECCLLRHYRESQANIFYSKYPWKILRMRPACCNCFGCFERRKHKRSILQRDVQVHPGARYWASKQIHLADHPSPNRSRVTSWDASVDEQQNQRTGTVVPERELISALVSDAFDGGENESNRSSSTGSSSTSCGTRDDDDDIAGAIQNNVPKLGIAERAVIEDSKADDTEEEISVVSILDTKFAEAEPKRSETSSVDNKSTASCVEKGQVGKGNGSLVIQQPGGGDDDVAAFNQHEATERVFNNQNWMHNILDRPHNSVTDFNTLDAYSIDELFADGPPSPAGSGGGGGGTEQAAVTVSLQNQLLKTAAISDPELSEPDRTASDREPSIDEVNDAMFAMGSLVMEEEDDDYDVNNNNGDGDDVPDGQQLIQQQTVSNKESSFGAKPPADSAYSSAYPHPLDNLPSLDQFVDIVMDNLDGEPSMIYQPPVSALSEAMIHSNVMNNGLVHQYLDSIMDNMENGRGAPVTRGVRELGGDGERNRQDMQDLSFDNSVVSQLSNPQGFDDDVDDYDGDEYFRRTAYRKRRGDDSRGSSLERSDDNFHRKDLTRDDSGDNSGVVRGRDRARENSRSHSQPYERDKARRNGSSHHSSSRRRDEVEDKSNYVREEEDRRDRPRDSRRRGHGAEDHHRRSSRDTDDRRSRNTRRSRHRRDHDDDEGGARSSRNRDERYKVSSRRNQQSAARDELDRNDSPRASVANSNINSNMSSRRPSDEEMPEVHRPELGTSPVHKEEQPLQSNAHIQPADKVDDEVDRVKGASTTAINNSAEEKEVEKVEEDVEEVVEFSAPPTSVKIVSHHTSIDDFLNMSGSAAHQQHASSSSSVVDDDDNNKSAASGRDLIEPQQMNRPQIDLVARAYSGMEEDNTVNTAVDASAVKASEGQ